MEPFKKIIFDAFEIRYENWGVIGNAPVGFPYGVDLNGPLCGAPNRWCNGQTVADFIGKPYMWF